LASSAIWKKRTALLRSALNTARLAKLRAASAYRRPHRPLIALPPA
jgi:hypothetical protein